MVVNNLVLIPITLAVIVAYQEWRRSRMYAPEDSRIIVKPASNEVEVETTKGIVVLKPKQFVFKCYDCQHVFVGTMQTTGCEQCGYVALMPMLYKE